MTAPSFIDTNILVYAFADTGDERHAVARSLVEELLNRQSAAVSVQVLREFYAVATRKAKKPVPRHELIPLINDLSHACRVVDDTLAQLERALDILESHDISIWDACIVAAAEASGCGDLYTEDLAHGATIGTVRILNPLLVG